MNKTKEQLKIELDEAKKEIKVLESKLKKRESQLEKVKTAQNTATNVELAYLYTAIDMDVDYVESLLNKTTLIRMTTVHYLDTIEVHQTRQFHDGNRVIITRKERRNKNEGSVYATFYKRICKE